MHVRHEGDVYESEVVVADTELELAHSLDERGRLYVANSASNLGSYTSDRTEAI